MKPINFDKTNLHPLKEMDNKNCGKKTINTSEAKAPQSPLSKLISLIHMSSESENASRIQNLKTQIAEKNYSVDFDKLTHRVFAEIELA